MGKLWKVALVVSQQRASGEGEEIGWAILELMGHRKLAGFVSDDQGLVRIDVHTEDPYRPTPHLTDPGRIERAGEPIATQWYGRAAIYCITASTMDICLRLAQSHQPAPVGRWELPESVESTAQEMAEDELAEDWS